MDKTKNTCDITIDPKKLLCVVSLCGMLVLENGGETYRAEDTVMRICRAFGYKETEIIAFPTGVIVTLVKDGEVVSHMMKRVRKRTINLDKLNMVNDISRRLIGCEIDCDRALAELAEVNKSSVYSKPLYALIAGVSTAFFALLYGGGFFDAGVAFLCGAVVQYISSMFRRTEIYKFAISMLGGMIIALLAVSSTAIFGIGSIDRIIIGAIIPLLPGLAMTTAIRDTMTGDLISSSARFTEVLLVALTLASGAGVVFAGAMSLGVPLATNAPTVEYGFAWLLVKDFFICALATGFFSLLISAPKTSIVASSLIASVGYIVYDLIYIGLKAEVAAYFFGTLVIAIAGEILARYMRMPSLVFTVTAIVPLVPGVGIYRTMLCLVEDKFTEAAYVGANTLFIAGAMALALALAGIAVGRIARRGKR